MTFKDCLYIIKNDRKAWLGLFAVVAVGMGAMILGRCTNGSLTGNDEYDSIQQAKDSSRANVGYDKGNKDCTKYFAVEERAVKLQPFDPNTADSTILLGLGLQAWQVRSIYKYRANGGAYTCKEDFARLYGLTIKKYRELEPYIRIAPEYRAASSIIRGHSYPSRHRDASGQSYIAGNGAGGTGGASNGRGSSSNASASSNAPTGYIPKLKAGQTISLNTSDTLELRKVPGIGAHFARKIARYREQLGGYLNKEQLLEIQDFPESALPYLTISATDASHIRKVKINKATSEQLRSHPYITYLMARQILDYRRLRGDIKDINELKLLPSFSPDIINKLRPYIAY